MQCCIQYKYYFVCYKYNATSFFVLALAFECGICGELGDGWVPLSFHVLYFFKSRYKLYFEFCGEADVGWVIWTCRHGVVTKMSVLTCFTHVKFVLVCKLHDGMSFWVDCMFWNED